MHFLPIPACRHQTLSPRKFVRYGMILLSLLLSFTGTAQVVADVTEIPPQAAELFASNELLDLTLKGDTRALFRDRSDQSSYHKMTLSYTATGGNPVELPLKVKTRGNFRRQRENCYYPPLLLNFPKKKISADGLFGGQNKIKLVTPCRDQDYVVREYLVYKLYNLITEKSFQARLVRITYVDERKEKATDPLYGILLEDEDQMAARIGSKIIKRNGLRPNKTEKDIFLPMAVFEFMIGNTDWSIQFRHNIKLCQNAAYPLPIPVPYDFDHAGIVNAPYAKPAPALELRSVQQRLYRGYCISNLADFDPVVKQFNDLKEAFYAVYTDCPGLSEKYVRQTLRFLDDFYKTINNPKNREAAFGFPCKKSGTGNIVIGGLKVK